jgi:hypothetical protein
MVLYNLVALIRVFTFYCLFQVVGFAAGCFYHLADKISKELENSFLLCLRKSLLLLGSGASLVGNQYSFLVFV